MVETATRMGTGAGGHAQHRRHQSSADRARARTRRAARQAGRAGLYLGLRLQRDRHFHDREAVAELPAAVGCAQPQFHDRGRAQGRHRKAGVASQRHRASRAIAARGRSRPAETDPVRKPVLDGRRRRAAASHLRSRRALWRADLCRRGSRRRHVRAAWRRHRRAGRRHGAHRYHRRHARQGLRLPRRLYRRECQSGRCRALLRARLHLHHRAAAGGLRGGHRRDPASEVVAMGARSPPGPRRPAEGRAQCRPAFR